MCKVKKVMMLLVAAMIFQYAGGQVLYYPAEELLHRTGAQFAAPMADPLIAFSHPATIADSVGVSFAGFGEKKFLLENLFSITAAASWRLREDAMTVGFSHANGGALSEQRAALGYAKQLGKVNEGIKVGYLSARAGELRVISAINTATAAIIRLTPAAYASVRLVNVHSMLMKQDSSGIRQVSSYHLGFGLRFSEHVYAGVENSKAEEQPPELLVMVAWSVKQDILLRSSWRVHTSQPFIAFTWTRNQWSFETGLSYHVVLGISPTCGLIYRARQN